MIELELTKEQSRYIALCWIDEQKHSKDGAKEILAHLFSGLHFVNYSWMDLIRYVCNLCATLYCVDLKYIKKDIV